MVLSHGILGDGMLIEAFKCRLIRPSCLRHLNETPKDNPQKLTLLWTTSYVYYGLLGGCSGDTEGENAGQGRVVKGCALREGLWALISFAKFHAH